MTRSFGVLVLALVLFGATAGLLAVEPAQAAPEGQITWGVHISLAPTWFGLITGHAYSAPYEDLKLKGH